MHLVSNWQAAFIERYNAPQAQLTLISYMLYYAIKHPDVDVFSAVPASWNLSDRKEELLKSIQPVHLANTDEQNLIKALVQFKAKFNLRYIDAKDETNFLLDHSARFNKPSVVSYLLREFAQEGYKFQKSDPIIINALRNAFIFSESDIITSLLAVSPESLTIDTAQFGVNLGYPRKAMKELYGSIKGVDKTSKNLLEQATKYMRPTTEGAQFKTSKNSEVQQSKTSIQLTEDYYTFKTNIYLASQASSPEESGKYLSKAFARGVEYIKKHYKACPEHAMLNDIAENCVKISISFDQIDSKMLNGLISIYKALPLSRDLLSKAIIQCYAQIDDPQFNPGKVIKWFFENHKEIKNDQLKLNFLEDIKTQSSGIYNATSVVDRKNIADAYSYI